MSERARAYYENRTAQLGWELTPRILDGRPVSLMPARAERLAGNFATYMDDVEPFILEGVRLSGGMELNPDDWEEVKGLGPYKLILTAFEYAYKHMARHVLRPPSDRLAGIYLEALADSEIPPLSFGRATISKPIARSALQEVARMALLTRTVTAAGEVSVAHLTILWGELKIIGEIRRTEAYLTPRYFGAPVLEKEMALLPELELS